MVLRVDNFRMAVVETGIVLMNTHHSPQSAFYILLTAGPLPICSPTHNTVQRGLCYYILYASIIYTMLIQCYRCPSNAESRERIWALIYNKGWMSDHITHTLFYIPESLSSWALLIDPHLERLASLDYID